MIQDKGINDMPYGWVSKNKWNKKVYKTWHHMLERCYSEKYHETRPTYKNCSVCKKWLLLSNFISDFKLIDGYDDEKFLNGELCLDKDIKSNGENKEYSLENCLWVSKGENSRQATKTRDYSSTAIKISQYDKKMNLIKIWNSSIDIQRELGISRSHIFTCCKWYECGENLEEWFKTHKENPRKSVGGYIFKYYEESEVAKDE